MCLLALATPLASPAVWSKAEVYFTDWDVLTRERWTIEKARKLAQHKKSFIQDASRITDMLSLDKLQPAKERASEDARLVVDLYTDAGRKVTYYASRFRLSSADDSLKRELDESFRKSVRSLFKEENAESGRRED
jgi:hypothetical protein